MKYLIFAVLFVSTFIHAQTCISWIEMPLNSSSHPFTKINQKIVKSCSAGDVLDVRIWNSAVSNEFEMDSSLISLQAFLCNYDKQIKNHKNSTFEGFTCILQLENFVYLKYK